MGKDKKATHLQQKGRVILPGVWIMIIQIVILHIGLR